MLNCPFCRSQITEEQLRDMAEASSFSCPVCMKAFRPALKHHWIYVLLALAGAWTVAYMKGFQSIVFAGAFLIYSAIAMLLLEVLGVALGLPKEALKPHPPFIQRLGLGDSSNQ